MDLGCESQLCLHFVLRIIIMAEEKNADFPEQRKVFQAEVVAPVRMRLCWTDSNMKHLGLGMKGGAAASKTEGKAARPSLTLPGVGPRLEL
jgi:hypothetical protein